MPSKSAPLTGAWSEGGCSAPRRSPPAPGCQRDADTAYRETEREAGVTAQDCRPPAASADPSCRPSLRAACRLGAGLERHSRAWSRGPAGSASPLASRAHGLPTARAPAVPLLFFWSPQNLQFPRFHGPRLAPPLPPPRRFSAMQLQGSLFPRLQIPAPPDSAGRRGRGGGRGARPGEQSRRARAQRQPGRPQLGAEAGGRGGEARPNAAMRTGSGASGFGAALPPRPSSEPQPLTLPRPGSCCHYRIWGDFPSP